MVQEGRETEAEEYLKNLMREFGDNLVAELQFNEYEGQKTYNSWLLKMIKKYSLMPILTNDVHYAFKEDAELQDTLIAINQKSKLGNSFKLTTRNLYYANVDDFHTFNKQFGFNYPESFVDMCLDNTLKVAEKLNYEFDLGKEKYPRYEPSIQVQEYFKTEDTKDIITRLAFAKLKQKLNKYKETGLVKITPEKEKEYYDRLTYELEVIENKSMLDYFMVNWEIVKFCKENNIATGPGRGCFQIGSRVKMSDGMYAPIETIQVGEYVFDAFGDVKKVIDTLEYEIDEDVIELEFECGRKITCTLDHEFLTNNRGWVMAKDLNDEDDISDIDKEKQALYAKLKNRAIKNYLGVVYDLTIEDSHCYNIEGLGVHNSAAGCLLSWCIDITKIDPIRFDLYFERFLNPSRNCLTKNCNVMLKDGSYKNIVDVEVGDPVQTEHGLGNLVQKHERELKEGENVYEIESEDGAIVQLTGCHIVPVFRNGKRIEVRVDEILKSDYLFVF
jgi:intein/homing endonuclease